MGSCAVQSKCFNPRICKRCDLISNMIKFGIKSFNPRICKRCDQVASDWLPSRGGFNPRICKRCDALALRLRQMMQVSIHASVKDATQQMRH